MPKLLILEPFYGGSHKQLLDTLTAELAPGSWSLVTLPDKKWHWRARTSALRLSQDIPPDTSSYSTLLASSVLSLAELLGLRPDLARLTKLVYFHENQLSYPVQVLYCTVLCCTVLSCTVLRYSVQAVKDRDFQFGYNQVTTCLCADTVLFNSEYNRDSFISNIPKFLSLQPDHRPDHRQIVSKIRDISQICYFPLKLPARPASVCRRDGGDSEASEQPRPLHIVWPHRHDHDKDPATFCRVVTRLHEAGHSFTLSVLGEEYSEVPPEMRAMQQLLGAAGKIATWGHLSAAGGYHATLAAADVVVSTARHETYGVAMLEAAWLGCYPLAPRVVLQKVPSEGS